MSGKVEFGAIAVGCPFCFGFSSNTYAVTEAIFHSPANVDWNSWLPTPGSCVLDPGYSPPVSSSLTLGGAVTLRGPTSTLSLSPSVNDFGLTAYSDPYATFTDYEKGASYDLEVAGAGGFTIPGAHQTTVGFDDIQPSSILSDDPYSFPYLVVAYGASFSWSPLVVSDCVFIDPCSTFSGPLYGEVLGNAPDTGRSLSRRVRPSSTTRDFIYRHEEGSPIHPNDGSTIQSLSSLGAPAPPCSLPSAAEPRRPRPHPGHRPDERVDICFWCGLNQAPRS